MAKKSWLEVLEEILSGYSGAPREKVNPNSFKIGSEDGYYRDDYTNPNSFYDTRQLDEGEAAAALRNDPSGYNKPKWDTYNPYGREHIGVYKQPQRSFKMKVTDPRAWYMNQYISSGSRSLPDKSDNRYVRLGQEVNAATNRNLNRGAMAILNTLGGKLIPQSTAQRAKQAVRNTARMDDQMLVGTKGMPRSQSAYSDLYNTNKARAAEARDVAHFIPNSEVPGGRLRDIVSEEAAFRDALASTYKPSKAYQAIRGAVKLSPFLLGGAYASGAFGKRAKAMKRMSKSISSISQNGTRHVVGGYNGSKMSKAMDMKTQSPKMPSTKRDVRHTDKYFN